MNPITSQPVAIPPVPQPASPMTGGKKMNKGVLAGIIAALVLLVAGAAWAVYALFTVTPESLTKDAFRSLSKETAIAFDFDISGPGARIDGTLASTTDDSNKNGEVILTFGEGSESVSVSLLSVDGNLFIKATNLEQIAPLMALYTGSIEAFGSSEFIAALESINGVWFEVTKEELKALAETEGGSVPVATSPQDVKKVLDIYDKHPFVKADKVFADETINGVKSAHFSVKIDKQQEAAFLDELKNTDLATIKLTDKDIASFKEATASHTGIIEFWIARDTKKFTKILFSVEASGEEVVMSFTRSAALPAFDKLERPADVLPISALAEMLFGPLMSTTNMEALSATDLTF